MNNPLPTKYRDITNLENWTVCERGELVDHSAARAENFPENEDVMDTMKFRPRVDDRCRPLGYVPPVGIAEGLRNVLRSSWGWLKAPFAVVILLALWVGWVSFRAFRGEER